MKTSPLKLITASILTLVLTLTALGLPITSDQPLAGWGEVTKGLGFCALASVATLGLISTSYCIKGAINNQNNHKAIDHYFDELRKFEMEKSMAKMAGARNTTDGFDDSKNESIGSEYSSDESDDATESDHAAVLARLLKANRH
jgi:hypothetical protein